MNKISICWLGKDGAFNYTYAVSVVPIMRGKTAILSATIDGERDAVSFLFTEVVNIRGIEQ